MDTLPVATTQPTQAEDVAAFRLGLMMLCGEEPTWLLRRREPIQGSEDLVERGLMEYLTDALEVSHAALYLPQWGPVPALPCVAALGRAPTAIPLGGALVSWLFLHGAAIPRVLRCTDPSVQPNRHLRHELLTLDAEAVIPLSQFPGDVGGLLVIGPPRRTPYEPTHLERLIRYGWKLRCLMETRRERQQLGLDAVPPHGHDSPAAPPSLHSLVVFDELPKIIQSDCDYLRQTVDLAIYGATSQKDAIQLVQTHRPQAILLDLSFYCQPPLALLRTIRQVVPEARVIGRSSECYEDLTDEEVHVLAAEFDVRPILPKHVPLEQLRQIICEAAP